VLGSGFNSFSLPLNLFCILKNTEQIFLICKTYICHSMKKIGVILAIGAIFVGFDLPKSAHKKIDKTIAAIWGEDIVITKTPVNLSGDQQKQLGITLENNNLFKLTNKDKNEGYLYLAQAPSRSDKIDYMIIFKPDLTIMTVQVLVYREGYGGEVGSSRWLKQFIGKSQENKMKFGDDIQNISGATISARAMTNGVSSLTININKIKSKGWL